jgi:hypothetical protein
MEADLPVLVGEEHPPEIHVGLVRVLVLVVPLAGDLGVIRAGRAELR